MKPGTEVLFIDYTDLNEWVNGRVLVDIGAEVAVNDRGGIVHWVPVENVRHL